jgi:hypothetical protein
MKPGMQRDLLVAFWFLFDEFELGDDPDPQAGPIPDDAKEPQKLAPTPSKLPSPAGRTDRPSR